MTKLASNLLGLFHNQNVFTMFLGEMDKECILCGRIDENEVLSLAADKGLQIIHACIFHDRQDLKATLEEKLVEEPTLGAETFFFSPNLLAVITSALGYSLILASLA